MRNTILNSLIGKYVWNRRRPRLSRSLLIRPKLVGALALPDFKKYFQSIVLNRISDWKYHRESKLWVALEMELSGTDLSTQIWIRRKYRNLSPGTSPLTRSSLMSWDSMCKARKWPYNSPLLPLTGHNYFPPGNIDPGIHTWNLGTKILLHQVTSSSGIIPLPTLLHNSTISIMDQWRHRQLAAFVHSLPKPLRSFSDLTPLEAAFSEDQRVEKPISHFYHILLTLASTFIRNWEQDLQKELSTTQRSNILILAHTSSGASKMAEVNYKLLTWWHYTPVVLHKTFPQTSPLCWRGCGERATRAHIWWYCPLICPFWLTILHWIMEIPGLGGPQ